MDGSEIPKPNVETTLPETNSKFAPENRPVYAPEETIVRTNHPFLGAKMLVSGRVLLMVQKSGEKTTWDVFQSPRKILG